MTSLKNALYRKNGDLETPSQGHYMYDKHNVYKHIEAQIFRKTKHILSIFLSLIFFYINCEK